MDTYMTIQGDTWDLIAWRLYGAERYMQQLIEANWDHADTLIFSAGTMLKVPIIDKTETADEAPFWRTEDE